MINSILKYISGKEVIIFNPHRNSNPLVNETTKKSYVFFNPIVIWKASAMLGRNTKLRYRFVASILSFINPISIIDINWTDRKHSLYFAWCKRNQKKFIVLQHGIYYAGMMSDIREKYTNCTTHLVWGDYFKQLREKDNPGKNCEFIIYGNPVYNQYDRNSFSYQDKTGNDILVAISVIGGKRLKILTDFLDKLVAHGFNVTIKEHNLQSKKSIEIQGYNKINENLYNLLQEQRFDFVITDVSSAMTDIIFFKNRAIYFSPEGKDHYHTHNVYEDYLVNIATRKEFFTDRKDLLNQISIESQENLLNYLIETEGTTNTLDKVLK